MNSQPPPPPAELQFRRKQLIVDRQWQGLVLFAVGGWMLTALLLTLGKYFLHFCRTSSPSLPTFFSFCTDNRYLLLALIVIYLMALRSTLMFSHRCAGPLFALMRNMKNLRAGEPVQRLVLRKHDYFKNVAETFNEMMDAFRARSREKRMVADQALGRVTALLKRTDLTPACRKELEALQDQIDPLRDLFFR